MLRVFLCALLVSPLCGEETGQIVLMRVRLRDGVATLVESTLRPGLLKARIHPRGSLRISLLAADGRELWNGRLNDPAEERREVADPDTGEIRSVPVEPGDPEILIRVQAQPEMSHVALHRERAVVASADGKVAKIERMLLGKFATPALK